MTKKSGSYITNLVKGVGYRLKQISGNKYKKAGLSWYKIKRLKHLPYNSPNTHQLLGVNVHFNNGPELLHSLKEIFVEDIYKINFKTSNPYIIDCGANIGLSVIYLKSNYPGARIIAFEPDPANFNTLVKNVDAFGWQEVELRQEAIWKENTILEFISDGTLGSKLSDAGKSNNVVKVKASSLKELLVKKVDFLKMDIEGAEYEVLKDCGEHLQVIENLFIEFHGFFDKMYELTDTLQLVQKNGFAYYIKEASNVYDTPFYRSNKERPYDLQLNIFCFKRAGNS